MQFIKKSVKKLWHPENKKLIIKYIIISVISYGFVFGGLLLLVDYFKTDKSLAFLIIYGLNYLLLYVIQLKFLFNTEHHIKKLLRFIGSILVFYFLANVLYNIGLHFKINYLIATTITIAVLMPFRFFISKRVVYKD
jgi:putative flippase GtrA